LDGQEDVREGKALSTPGTAWGNELPLQLRAWALLLSPGLSLPSAAAHSVDMSPLTPVLPPASEQALDS